MLRLTENSFFSRLPESPFRKTNGMFLSSPVKSVSKTLRFPIRFRNVSPCARNCGQKTKRCAGVSLWFFRARLLFPMERSAFPPRSSSPNAVERSESSRDARPHTTERSLRGIRKNTRSTGSSPFPNPGATSCVCTAPLLRKPCVRFSATAKRSGKFIWSRPGEWDSPPPTGKSRR